MIITSIREYQKRKVLVQLDGHLELPLYKREVGKYHLEEDSEISNDTYSELLSVLAKRVKLRAMALLEKRSYTTEKLRQKLAENHYPYFMIEDALEYVSSYGYLNDLKYTEEYIRCYYESRSRRRINQELCGKGISREIIEKAWVNHEEVNEPQDEISQIKALLQKKNYHAESADYKETSKVINYLYRKGYCIEDIKRSISGLDDYF